MGEYGGYDRCRVRARAQRWVQGPGRGRKDDNVRARMRTRVRARHKGFTQGGEDKDPKGQSHRVRTLVGGAQTGRSKLLSSNSTNLHTGKWCGS